jgi:hypothetical protein
MQSERSCDYSLQLVWEDEISESGSVTAELEFGRSIDQTFQGQGQKMKSESAVTRSSNDLN